MDILIAFLIVAFFIALFLCWRIPIGRRIKREEQNFIEEHITNCSILIFYGDELDIGDWSFSQDMFSDGFIYKEGSIHIIKSYYGRFTLALPPGEYTSASIFDFNYGNGSKLGGTGYTERVRLNLNLSQGTIYRYRLKYYNIIPKKVPFEILVEKEVRTTANNIRQSVILDQVLN